MGERVGSNLAWYVPDNDRLRMIHPGAGPGV